MIKASTHGKNRGALHDAIDALDSFNTGGALRGRHVSDEPVNRWTHTGELRHADLTRWEADRDDISYVVWSYSTPIGWYARGSWYKVGQRFSVTTSKHAGFIPNTGSI